LKDDSILRKLPAVIDPKQMLFFDGIRHCAEICDFSYCRLKDVLTSIANDAEYPRELTTAAFVDAWSIVDAMHRFKSLWKLQPNATLTPPLAPAQSIDQEFSDVVKVRNVADHLAQQADRIVKKNGNALGELSWVTVNSTDPFSGLSCVLLPGTAKNGKHSWHVPQKGDVIEVPTGKVRIRAGTNQADLSVAMVCLARRIENLESALASAFSGIVDQKANDLDIVIRATLGLEK
jgi:hypothetical protein